MTAAWAESTIGDEFEVQLGKRVDSAVARGVPKTCINNRGVRWGRIEVAEAAIELLSKADLRDLRLRYGDVLVCEGGEIGRASVWRDELPEAYYLNTLHRLRPKGRYQADLIAAFLERWADTGELQALIGKSSLAHLTKENLLRVRLPVPRPEEQERIAVSLRTMDELVQAHERLIAKKRDIKQGMMQELLTGRTRLPCATGEWRQLQVAAESQLKARIGWQGLTTKEYRSSGKYRLVGGTEFRGGRVSWDKTPFVDKWRFDQDTGIQLRVGDVLLTKDGTIGKAAFVDSLPGPATLNSGVFVLRPKRSAYDPEFLYWMLRSRVFAQFVAGLSAGSTITHLYQRDLVTLVLSVPPTREEQRAIAAALSAVDAEILALERRLASARAIKTGMMQELLTGRTRLPLEAAS